MERGVALVKRLNNRDIQGTNEQLALVLNGGGLDGFSVRHGENSDLFFKLCSSGHLFATWRKFSKGKHGKPDVQLFERHLEQNIFELQEQLKTGQYKHGSYEPFIVHDPKRRQIHKASVVDRLVHQAVSDIIEPFFESRFIFDSFSCRKGKGTHAAVRRSRQFLRQASANNTRTVYGLKCDIRQFFASVEHQKLLNMLSIQIKDEKIIELLRKIISSFEVEPGKGIPLGNVTSQLFANVYMHELDWFVKHELREKYYIRYCDDFIIISTDQQHLLELVEPITIFLDTNLRLRLHPNKVILRSWGQGIDFLGYMLKPHCTVLRTKTKRRMLKRVNSTNLASYLGLCSHADSHELQQLIQTITSTEENSSSEVLE